MNTLKKYKTLNDEIKKLQTELEPLRVVLITKLESKKSHEMSEGDYKAILKIVTMNRFDTKSFKIEHGDLYETFLTESVQKRLTVL